MRTRMLVATALTLGAGSILILAGGIAIAAPASATFKGHELAGEAKVTIEQARQIALKARRGRIKDEELEHESGGSGLRYTFDIREGKFVYEVGVDAASGEVLENQREGSDPG